MKQIFLQSILSVALAAGAGCVWAQPATRPATLPVTTAQIEPLIQQLGAESFRVRQAAEDKLVAIGDAARPLLTKLLAESKDPEARSRAASTLREISRRSLDEPTLISLHVKDAPMSRVIAELARQAGIEIDASSLVSVRGEQKNVTLDVDRQPFWEVLRQICAQSGCGPERYSGSGNVLRLSPRGGDWANRPAVMRGLFMVMAANVQRHETLDFGKPNNPSRQYAINMQICADPKLRIISWPSYIEVSRAVDEKGNSLVVTQGTSSGFLSGPDSMWHLELETPLQLRPDIGKKLVEFKGVARFGVQTKAERWELDNPLKIQNQEKKVANNTVTLTIKNVARGKNDDVEVQIAIHIKTSLNLLGRRTDSPHMYEYQPSQSIKIVDAQGHEYERISTSSSASGNTEECILNFQPHDNDGRQLGAPDRLIWEIPTEIKEFVVPVEFHDLPLP